MSKYSSLLAGLVFLSLAMLCKLKFVPFEANFAIFGALSIFCGAYLRGFAAWLIPLLGIALTDLMGDWFQIPGVYRYDLRSMLLNYAGFAAMIGVGHVLRNRSGLEWVLGSAFAGSIAFFLISNFGCWLDPLLKYERSLNGLLQCYTAGLYFFRYTLASDMVFTLLFVGAYRLAISYLAENARAADRV